MDSERVCMTLEYEMDLQWAPEKIFPLLCPVREYEWILHWRCDMIRCRTGRAELGCVFATDFKDGFGREIWVVNHYQPVNTIGFVRIGPLRSTRYEITLRKGLSTKVIWFQEVTSLSRKGDQLVTEYGEAGFEKSMSLVHRMLKHYLATGRKLSLEDEKVASHLQTEEIDG